MKIGILGGGQLGRMLILAGYPLGFSFKTFSPSDKTPASEVADHTVASFTDREALRAFAKECDVVTYEFENIPTSALSELDGDAKLSPSIHCLSTCQDRLNEKKIFEKLKIPTPRFATATNANELAEAILEIGTSCVIKTHRDGYDGKGQRVLENIDTDAPTIWKELGDVPLIVEERIPFDMEVSQILARTASGQISFYPLTQNWHSTGILRQSVAPAKMSDSRLATLAEDYARRLAEELSYVGVLAIEFFVLGDKLIANEMAPRVHNSGHWTMNAGVTSQFENHLRAICGLPLGPTKPRQLSGMINCIGKTPDPRTLQLPDGAFLHIYGKQDKPGRKVAHINVIAEDRETLLARISQVKKIIATEAPL